MKLLFTVAQGYLTKFGLASASLITLVENVIAFVNGDEFQTLLTVGQETWSALGILASLAVTTWGGFRASINYNGHTK